MDFREASELESGDELYHLDGVGRTLKDVVSTYLSGPHKDTMYPGSRWVVVVRNSAGKVVPYNIVDMAPKPATPKVGETWIHRLDGPNKSRYVDDVTERYVITKASSLKGDDQAHIMTMDFFLTTYKRQK